MFDIAFIVPGGLWRFINLSQEEGCWTITREVTDLKRIYLIRHCKAAGQEPSAPLTPEGLRQAEQLSDFLAERPIDEILSSPYDRAMSTLRPLARRLDLKIHTDDRLAERVLSAEPLNDWMERLSLSFADLDATLPGGESSREAMERGISAIQELYKRPAKNIAVATHGNLMALILKYYDDTFGFDHWKALTNPDVYELAVTENEGVPRIARIWGEGRS